MDKKYFKIDNSYGAVIADNMRSAVSLEGGTSHSSNMKQEFQFSKGTTHA
jgi:hypothetical protein